MTLTGLMQDRALTMGSLVDHVARNHRGREVAGRDAAGKLVRSSWGEVAARARRVAAALSGLGLEPGDRVATLAWNRIPHLELYFGVTAAGLVLHTVNPRLYPEQLVYILNHGGAKVLCVDPDLLGIVEGIADQLDWIETIVVLCARAELPESGLPDLVHYEQWLTAALPLAAWPDLDERSAAILCYTSGTTGNPKGVLYSHRSTLLHAMSACSADSMAMAARDNALLVTPLFHVNAWGVPFAAAMAGAKLVLPGSQLDPASILSLLDSERITFSLGVPTVWLGFAAHHDALPAAERPRACAATGFHGRCGHTAIADRLV
ncbi:AMP-binding protein [Novosphingobium sp.]|uniref:AMP-binding protein n=1 Tax=Novosphingobium sp. TaxID=1874826 RepID=UPI0025F43DA2|nr:AMP-binding protein [Novosphingobium sp.]